MVPLYRSVARVILVLSVTCHVEHDHLGVREEYYFKVIVDCLQALSTVLSRLSQAVRTRYSVLRVWFMFAVRSLQHVFCTSLLRSFD